MAKKTAKKTSTKKTSTKNSSPSPSAQPSNGSAQEPISFEVNYITQEPYYRIIGSEEKVFLAAAYRKDKKTKESAPRPVLLKGPTGCGKTRFLEYMAYRLERPLITVAAHEDLSKDDLVGRAVLEGLEGKWRDGPLLTAVKKGAIFYLDEMVEARSDTTVAIHPVTDHRRELPVDALVQLYHAHPQFMFVGSYNPGYQSIQKNMKPSTMQRFASIVFDYPPKDIEMEILVNETGIDQETATGLVEIAHKVRSLKTESQMLDEGASTRLLVIAADLMLTSKREKLGLTARDALYATIRDSVTDSIDSDEYKNIMGGISEVIGAYFDE